METVTEKQFLTEEELNDLKLIQQQTQTLVLELGEIEMIKLQIESRYQNAKNFLEDLTSLEQSFSKTLFEKYGKVNVDPQTGELTKLD
jgi:hypothetical protein